MAQVPFSGVPQATPSTQSLGRQALVSPTDALKPLTEGISDLSKTESQMGDMLAQHAARFQEQDNEAEADKAYSTFLDKSNALLYGDGTQNNVGFYNLRGQAALAAYPEMRDKLLGLRDEIASTLPNRKVQIAFDSASRRLASYSLSDASRHAASERKSYLASTASGVVQTSLNDIALNYHDPQRIGENLATIDAQYDKMAELNGWAPEQTQAEKQKAHSTAWTSIIDRVADTNPYGAQNLMRQHADELTMGDATRLDKMFKSVIPMLQGYDFAQKLLDQYQWSNEDPAEHLRDLLGKVDDAAGGNPMVKRVMEQQVRSQVSLMHQAIMGERKGAADALAGVLDGGPQGKGVRPTSIEQLFGAYQGAKDDFAKLDARGQAHVIDSLARNSSGRSIQPTDANMRTFAQLLGQAHSDPDTFKTLDLSKYELPFSSKQRLMQMQVAIANRNPPNQNIMRALAVAKTVGLDETIPKSDTEARDVFTGRLSQEIDSFYAVHNRRPSDSDVRDMSRRLLTEEGGFLGFGKTGAYEKPYVSLIDGVPDEAAKKIVAAHRAKGWGDPNPGQIKYWYDRMHANAGR